ncbi:MAG: hypothetical protein LBO77_02645, partial [Desulfovibrio sp.]|nr:hypothetical protein [Desulfovibrio sp.]
MQATLPATATAVCAGPLARAALTPGEVIILSVFARSLYAASSSGAILCLCGPELPLGPFSLICGQWERITAQNPEKGDSCPVDRAGGISLGRIYIQTADAAVWSPEATLPSGTNTAVGLARLAAHPFPARNSLADLLPCVLGGPFYPPPDAMTGALLERGRQGISAVLAWLRLGAPYLGSDS